ncbi:MAG: hypothetical protein MZU97_10090 [Bacillus subtilis]|nr:hypothetical protein [Bacillus subtilis]
MLDAFKTPDGVPGKAILLTDAAPTDGGIIVHAGDTKYSGNDNIQGAVLTDVAAGRSRRHLRRHLRCHRRNVRLYHQP